MPKVEGPGHPRRHSPPLATQLLTWVMEMGRVAWAPSIGSVHLHWCHFLAVDWVGLCRCVTNADWRLADCRVNQVRIVVKCFYRFPILKLESSKSLV